ncbi:23S rRNA (adenine(2030)-N(6))-methyltransferase RlmJ [Legionella jordanis]|uniref:Ribosomal RNA large subunit methyltransferase J n=1 Tax=Legionella jordanis TaxID=456 RepID=A0A0W0V7W0_9GAMM|nr:23S rRNA (adenine(2030)-N(6))-methyltransferase RlmJ [Legionella jordanis]KTD16208.1 protein involved in catabolism of external DNA [Legionella jordanis]RMX04571.1 23S rRNA (adenine(2030)-N(6))-methyltransferase RlmJ [Legionella jordanis]RMX21117.1 23S rRNA (adenine(2030)-N(6))-methyltransferase RlmJ [Legionella jordanis]VEH12334.1 protein involved in catabolism of external DNA [Legionella jordanis]HAT8713541.1 23S rRNA (adenine(2030)-N(6))-methyltransferase RlmJ [Legionella jordanis]
MLSYQHGYHAGNFADVIKHLTLSRILHYMVQKDKPLFYLETHAGRGLYDLKDSKAIKTAEYLQGVQIIWQHRHELSAHFSPYLQCINKLNATTHLRFYPGSPALAIELLRPEDRLYFCELHPREFEELQQLRHGGKRVFYSHSDGVESLKALMPPPERRAVIFLDPSYEIKDEYKSIPKAINMAFQRFPTGVFCLWYPIVDKIFHEQLVKQMTSIPAKSQLRLEFNILPTSEPGMTGCGLWILNPPYKLSEEMRIIFKQMQELFKPKSSFLVED